VNLNNEVNPATQHKYPTRLSAAFVLALLNGNLDLARSQIRNFVKDRQDLRYVYLNVFEPAAYEIVKQHEAGKLSPAEAHFSILAVQELIESFSGLVFDSVAVDHRAFVSSMPGEVYDVPARLVADLLQMEGFDTCFLSSPRGLDEIEAGNRAENFDIVMLVATSPNLLSLVEEAAARLRIADPRIKVVIGGIASQNELTWPRWSMPDATFTTATEAVAAAKELVSGQSELRMLA
jgi:methanogenic corrinoid protein MtbC1